MVNLVNHIRNGLTRGEDLFTLALGVFIATNPIAQRIFQMGYNLGHAQGMEIGVQAGIEETMDAYDELHRRLLTRVAEVSDRQARTEAAQELVVAPAMTQPMNLEQSEEVTTL